MSEIEITVRGTHTWFAPPERATVRLVVALEAAEASTVHEAVAQVAINVRGSIEPLHRPDSGPVTWWASDQIQTWANRPWHKEGKRLPMVYHARLSFLVKFSDFAELSRWVTHVSEFDGTSIAGIDWALTATHREESIARVRAGAVQDAIRKAQAYADAVGAGQVRIVAIADAGMLGEGLHPTAPQPATFARSAAPGGGADVDFTPNDISINAEVDARCITV